MDDEASSVSSICGVGHSSNPQKKKGRKPCKVPRRDVTEVLEDLLADSRKQHEEMSTKV